MKKKNTWYNASTRMLRWSVGEISDVANSGSSF